MFKKNNQFQYSIESIPDAALKKINAKTSPLSLEQQRLWFIHNLDSIRRTNNLIYLIRVNRSLNISLFKKSINTIISRHEVLRTKFINLNGTPLQVIEPHMEIPIPLISLDDLPDSIVKKKSAEIFEQETSFKFNLDQTPLLRVTIIKLKKQEFRIVIVIHHIVSDNQSILNFLKELQILYDSLANKNSPSILPELTWQYTDYVQYQQDWINSTNFKNKLVFWKEKLQSAPELLALPTDYTRDSLQSPKGSYQKISVPKHITNKLKELAFQQNTTLYMILLSTFKVLLYRYTSQLDILVGIPDRINNNKTKNMIGYFMNFLVIRSQFKENQNFLDLLQIVSQEVHDAFLNSDVPNELLISELRSGHDISYHPLFQVMFSLNKAQPFLSSSKKTFFEAQPILNGLTLFDLSLLLEEHEDNIKGVFEYNSNLFCKQTIEQITNHYLVLLGEILDDPLSPVSSLPIINKTEKQRILYEWNEPSKIEPAIQYANCIQIFEKQVNCTPYKTAIVFEKDSLTYIEWNKRANRLANYFIKKGIKPDDLIGVCIDRSVETVVALLGVWKAGAAYVPLDPTYPRQRILGMLESSNPKFLLTESKYKNYFQDSNIPILYIDKGEGIQNEPSTNPNISIKSNSLAYVIFTSGTTGKPKGAMIEHHSLVSAGYGWKEKYCLNEKTRILCITSISFDVFSGDLVKTIVSGGTLIIFPDHTRIEMQKLYELMVDEKITYMLSTPGLVLTFLNYIYNNQLPIVNLQVLEMGGDYVTVEEFRVQLERFGDQFRIFNAYGITETTVQSSSFESNHENIKETLSGYVPIGKPLPGCKYYILNEKLQIQPPGVIGELYIGGSYVGRGYYQMDELTKERFISNPFSPGERMYKTGDLVRWTHDGNIEYLGRIDHQVKIRGFRIELGEINSLLSKHPSLDDSVVIAINNPTLGKQLVAFIVPSEEHLCDIQMIRNDLKKVLPVYMIPSVFVCLESLPYTPNGKVDRTLLEKYKIDNQISYSHELSVARDSIEFELQLLWQEVLNQHKIGLRQNFFELGGHSLALIQLQSLIKKKLGKEIPLTVMFQKGTIEEMAAIIRKDTNFNKQPSVITFNKKCTNNKSIFLIHQVGGYCFRYRHLAHLLGKECSIYGLQISNPEGDFTSIEEMAKNYIREIKLFQPHGPYFLVGHSLGGSIAFEMALQLQTAGEQVGFIALLDSFLTPFSSNLVEVDHFALTLEYINERFKMDQTQIKELLNKNEEERLEFILEAGKRANYYRSDMDVIQLKRVLSVHIKHMSAWKLYKKPKNRYHGKLLFFQAEKEEVKATNGWEELITQPMDVYPLFAEHYEVIEEPHVQTVASKILENIKDVLQNTT